MFWLRYNAKTQQHPCFKMKTKTESLAVTLEQQLDHRELAPGVSAFKLTRRFVAPEGTSAWFKGALTETVQTGLAKTAHLKKFLSGALEGLPANREFSVCSPEYLQRVQEYGYCMQESDKELSSVIQEMNAAPLNTPEGWSVVRDDFGGHMLFDTEDRPLPVGLVYNYLSGNIRDGCYDMDKLIPYLNAHPQVHPCLGRPADRITLENVPYYNVSPGCKTTANFVFSPTQEQMQDIWKTANELNKKYPSTALREAVFELDLLGLRAAGITRGDGYYGVSEDDESGSNIDLDD